MYTLAQAWNEAPSDGAGRLEQPVPGTVGGAVRRRIATVLVTLVALGLSAAGWDLVMGDADAPRAAVPAPVAER